MDSHRKSDAAVGQERSRSGVFKALSPHLISKLRGERRAAAVRVDAFRPQIVERHASSGDQEVSWLALQEIDTAHEELRVAEEEVHALADKLLAARADIEAERLVYRELFESAPDAYLVTSDKGAIIQANDAAGELFNINPALLLGKPLVTLIAPAERSAFVDVLSSIGASVARAELRVSPRNDAASAWVAVSARRGLSAHDASYIRWLLRPVREDESQQRRRIEELEESQRTLRELLEREQKASHDAEERNRQKGYALAAIAHEIRGPLGTIAGWLHMLDKGGMGAEVRKRAALSMTRGVRALARLVDDLVEHARVENHKISLDVSSLNLVRLVAEVTEDIRPLAELKKLHLQLSADPFDVTIHGDRWRLQQVFRNLLGNAIKFTCESGTVRVATTVVGAHAQVSVSDTGRGIAAGDLNKIFAPFAQLSEPRSSNDGLGLGLSIAHGIIELHGGTLEAHSEGVGRGSTLVVRLPIAQQA
jgi:PAS domain S-box-containing protein